MLFYAYFYKKFGIRIPSQMTNPVMTDLDVLELPRNAVYHFQGGEVNEVGPSSEDSIFKTITKPIMMEHVFTLSSEEGNPRRLPIVPETMIRKYHTMNRRFKMLHDISTIKDQLMLVVYNYAMVDKLYRYMRSAFTDYYRWKNSETLLWSKVAEVCTVTDRDQYIILEIPKLLPSVSNLKKGETDVFSSNLTKIFTDNESRTLLEIWKWLGHSRSLSILDQIPPGKYDRVNLIFIESGKWFVVNLGVLNSWRIATKEELEKNPDLTTKGMAPEQLQKYFLRMLVVATSLRTGATIGSDLLNDVGTPLVEVDEQEEQLSDEAPRVVVAGVVANKGTLKPFTEVKNVPVTATAPAEVDPKSVEEKLSIATAKEVDRDLAQLERITQSIEKNKVVAEEGIDLYGRDTNHTLETGIEQYCVELAENGRMSAAEYRRFTQLSQSYKVLKAPDGKQTLEKFIKVEPEDLQIKESKAIPDIKDVPDKTMLKSSLLDFNKRYIENILHKDIAASVLNIQNAGIAITSYEVERVSTIMGDHDAYSVQLVPVSGKPSTIRFNLPVVDEYGTFKANGTLYKARLQVGDLPIHKVASNRVALTSYYGKLFISRSEKKVNDYGSWLASKIMLMGLDKEDERITELNPGNIFDHLFECPKLYSMLSQHFIGFHLTISPALRYVLSFNHLKRDEFFTPAIRKIYEVDGSILVGVEASRKLYEQLEYLVIDKESNLFKGKNGVLTPVGSFEEFIGVDATGSPTEFATMRVMGQEIPVGVILAYELGLSKLIASLKASCRRVEAGKRVNLLPTEYTLVFEDETLVFDKGDVLASLILAGFNEYKQAIKLYSVYEFDKPNVYLNVLEAYKLGIRYIKEVRLVNELFIDPITREILEELHEPTTFRGLLMRACELLQVDYHPSEIDPAWMRKKGYERFAGAVYSEIIKSIRTQRSRIDNSRAPVELNPMAVWINISQDPSKVLLSEINPIQNLKETEAVTFGGTGGRNSRSMVKHTRAYHKNDMGVISESTVDASDVGINTFTSADPQFSSLRGMARPYVVGETGATALFSTSALLAPCSDRDDSKRV